MHLPPLPACNNFSNFTTDSVRHGDNTTNNLQLQATLTQQQIEHQKMVEEIEFCDLFFYFHFYFFCLFCNLFLFLYFCVLYRRVKKSTCLTHTHKNDSALKQAKSLCQKKKAQARADLISAKVDCDKLQTRLDATYAMLNRTMEELSKARRENDEKQKSLSELSVDVRANAYERQLMREHHQTRVSELEEQLATQGELLGHVLPDYLRQKLEEDVQSNKTIRKLQRKDFVAMFDHIVNIFAGLYFSVFFC